MILLLYFILQWFQRFDIIMGIYAMYELRLTDMVGFRILENHPDSRYGICRHGRYRIYCQACKFVSFHLQ